MEVIRFGALTDELRDQLEGDEQDPFDSRGNPLQYRAKDRHVGLKDEQGRVVASTGLLVIEGSPAGAFPRLALVA